MNELASLGLILLFALFAGHIVKLLRIPEVTGYILAGIVVGPHVLGWITNENLRTLEVFSEVALGLILFSIGSVFEMSRLRAAGMRVATITVIESALAAALVAGGMLAAAQPWPIALLLGAIAIETAAASTLMVMREYNSAGPFTDALTGIIAMNNILCIVAFSIVAAIVDFSIGSQPLEGWYAVYLTVYPLVWQIVGSAALGYLVGLLLAAWSAKVVEKGETLILLTGCVLLTVGVATLLELSPLVASLAVGATMANLSAMSRRLFEALSETDPPLYAIFFVIAGADLNLKLVASLGLLGAIYVFGRLAGKYAGAWIGAKRTNVPPQVRRTLGFALFSQAGLAIGLTLAMHNRFPSLAPVVNTIVLSSVVVFEIIGPLSARMALSKSGEIRKQPHLAEPVF
ncbi:MAG: cation:proton antiporter [Acidobacteria bacterium]|nr:cation:proton antiporter [Acidobacteriota bacterium]